MAWVAIAVACGDGGDAHGVRGHEGAAVADPVSGWEVAHERDAGRPLEDGLDEVLPGRDGRDTVEEEPGAGHFALRVRVVGQSGAVGEMDAEVSERAAPLLDRLPEGSSLLESEFPVFIG